MNVTAIVPIYNAEKYIIETLNSLINQFHPLDEILVVDDCSTDHSLKLVQEYSEKHSKIKIIELPYNKGVSAARNQAIMESRNDWVLMMDADDTAHPKLLQAQIKKLVDYENINPSPVCVHPAYIQMDAKGNVLPNSEYYGKQLTYNETFGSLLVRNYIITASGLLINREAAIKIGCYNVNISLSEDYEFLLRLSRQGTFIYLEKPYIYYRRHLSNASSNSEKIKEAGKAILDMYTIDEIKEAIFRRDFSEQKNLMDFVVLLFQFQKYDEGFLYLNDVKVEEFKESKLFYQALYFIEKNHDKSYEKNCIEHAIDYLDDLVRVNDEHGAALNNLGVLYAKLGDTVKARALFEKALILFPGYMDVTHNLAALHKGNEEFHFTKRELRKNLLRYS